MMTISVSNETISRFERRFASLAESSSHKKEHVNIERSSFVPEPTDPSGDAIHVERPWRLDINHVDIEGPYDRGVVVHFGLYAGLTNISTNGPKTGFWVGNGVPVWPDATHFNSASNQSVLDRCRHHGQSVDDIGFDIDGAANVFVNNGTVEGHDCKIGWRIRPRAAKGSCRLQDCWLETVNGCKTAIVWDGYNGKLIIDNLTIKHLPDVLLDTRGDQGSTVVIQNNTWDTIPPIKLDPTTTVVFGAGNSFSCREFYNALV